MAGRAALYLRVSTDGQAGDERASLAVQERDCRALAERSGWTIVATELEAQSAYNDSASRAGYQRILTLARAKAIDHIVIWQFSRFGRDAGEALTRMRELRRLGVTVHSPNEDLSSPLFTGILAVLAEDESRRIGDRVRPAKRLRASQGIFQGSRIPTGYVRDSTGAIVPSVWAAGVRRLFALAADGWGSAALAREFKRTGELQFGHHEGLRYILRNPAYRGALRAMMPDGQRGEVPAPWPALVDEATWRAANATLDARRILRPQRDWQQRFWTAGLIVCAQCGQRAGVVQAGKYGHIYHRCHRHVPETRARQEKLAAWIVVELEHLTLSPTLIPHIRAGIAAVNAELATQPDSERAHLETERRELARRRERVEAGYIEGVYSASRARELKGDADERIARIDIRLATLPPPTQIDTDAMVTALTRPWSALLESGQGPFQAALRWVVSAVTIGGNTPSGWRIEYRAELGAVLARLS